jgi:hypothetical protein
MLRKTMKLLVVSRYVYGRGYARWLVAVLLALSPVSCPPVFAIDLAITAANVKIAGTVGQCETENVIAGEAVTAGQAVYYDPTTNEYLLCENDGAELLAEAAGIVIQGNAADSPIIIATKGPIVIGGPLTIGMNLVVSANDGAVCPPTDLASSRYVSSLGHAVSTTVFWIDIKNYGVELP